MKLKKHYQTVVKVLPKCDFCNLIAKYDGKTIYGAWAFMCQPCFNSRGMGLGLGNGQELLQEAK